MRFKKWMRDPRFRMERLQVFVGGIVVLIALVFVLILGLLKQRQMNIDGPSPAPPPEYR